MKQNIAYSGKENNFRKLLANMLKASGYETVFFSSPESLALTVLRSPDDYDAVLIDMSQLNVLPPEVSSMTALVPVIMLCSGPVDQKLSRTGNEPFQLGTPLSVPRLLRLLQKIAGEKNLTKETKKTNSSLAMVVDDCSSIRLFIREILKTMGYQVTEAENGREALDILDKDNCPEFSTFVVDLEMPEVDGPTLIKELNKRFDSPQIIITTGTKDINLLNWARTTGLAIGLIEKPFSSKSFIRFLTAHR